MKTSPRLNVIAAIVLIAVLNIRSTAQVGAANDASAIVSRATSQMSRLLDQFSNVKCTELVEQEKLRSDGKVELKEESTYDYLAIITENGGELSLNESRVAVRQAKLEKRATPMLLSNGFATLFLVFHPYYADSFHFKITGAAVADGHNLVKVAFDHIQGTRSPAALALRGREYPLELSGEAWIDPETGSIARIEAGVADTLQDLGLNSIQSEVEFAPVSFHNSADSFWLPSAASVEVETPRQHWRNTHRFTDYKQFSVSTEENVASK